jgi:hypothetical protein
MLLVRFTGHPLPDAGVATLCAMSGKRGPDELTLDDFDIVADELTANYFSGIMGSYLSCVFMNSEYVQPEPKGAEGKKKKTQTRKEYEERVLRAHRWRGDHAASSLHCAFSGEPATHLVHRSQIPMLTGEDVLNFFPAGRGTLPISGPYLLAIQALPMGGRRAEGKLLFSHSDDPELMIALARACVNDNRRLLSLGRTHGFPKHRGPDASLVREQAAGLDPKTKQGKFPDVKAPMSLVADDLRKISQTTSLGSPGFASVTVYALTNLGTARPPKQIPLEIHSIPSQAVKFFRLVNQPPTGTTWRSLVNRAWVSPWTNDDASGDPSGAVENKNTKAKRSSKKHKSGIAGGAGLSRNDLYADFFRIFDADFTDMRSAQVFLRQHLLRCARWNRSVEMNASTGGEQDLSLVDWKLVDLFLREVIGMDTKRIEKIRDFADKLAVHIEDSKDKGLFRNVVFSTHEWEVRNALCKAQRNQAMRQGNLLFGLQDYLDVFEADGAVGIADWRLTRDLISIRLVESLHSKSFFGENPDLLDSSQDDPSATEA